ncbi:MAG: CGLD27 family protein [Leptolyngbya sp. IPPAS B-1204]|nr:CGLD27 family protein [Elainella sp. C42_A2020_010]
MNSSAPVCPVPAEQQPINEYQELKESWFFRWATLELGSYLKPIVILWVVGWLLAAPVAAVSFPPAKYPLQFFLSGAAGAMVLPLLALIRLYLGWIYVCNRLLQPTVFYEESGWYDGQVWQKPEEVLQRDRLIVTYQIRSLLRRLQLTFIVIASLLLADGMIWIFL